MPNRHSTLNSLFTDIANAIRTKKGEASSVKYVADNFDTAIASIQTFKPEETFNVTPSTSQQTITPSTGHVFSGGTVQAMPTGSATTPATTIAQSTPTVTGAVSGTNYVVTASVAQKTQDVTPTVSAGYISAGTAGTITLSANSGTLNIPCYTDLS